MTPDLLGGGAFVPPAGRRPLRAGRSRGGRDRRPRRPHSRLGGLPRGLSRRCAAAVERRRRRRSRTGRAHGGSASRKTGLRNVVGKARGGDPRARHGTAARAPGLAPHRGLSAGRRDAHAAVPRAVALSGVDGDGAVPPSRGERLRRLAGRGAVASPVLPDVRIPARDGPAGRRRSRAQASALVRLLRHALAVQANRLPVL